MMDFYEVVDQVVDLLRRRGRVTYRSIKAQFQLDDDQLELLKEELLYAYESSIQADDRGFAWSERADSAAQAPPPSTALEPRSHPATEPERSPASYTPSYLAERILTAKSSLEGERKVVTVLFADIKDSTELIRDLDPEAAQKLLDPAIHIMMEAVHRFEGTVNQVLGDGIMSIFGAPLAHEDHAARACYAALAMQSAMRDYTEQVRRQQGIELHIRVGLNSGEVVVRTISSDLHMDYSAVGSTTHLAARMEQLANPGSIRLSAATLRLVEGLVQVHALGPVPVKGMDEPVEIYELTGASSIRRRLQAAVTRGLTKFVGRDTEIDALNQALEKARDGQGQLVAAVGEAGVGKSRLIYEFVNSYRMQGWLVLESASVSYGKATPYFPVIDLLRRYTHVEDGDDARTIRAKVTGQILTLDETLQDTIPALLSLLDALSEDSPFLNLEPPQRRQCTLDGLKQILLRESQVQPLVLVFEDLHWIDSETQALLDDLVESLPTARLLLLVNYRPEYTHSWGSKTYYTELRLDPLPPESADAFLEALLGEEADLASLKQLLVKRTEGNPFFLEESVRTLVELQVLTGEPGAYRLAQHLPTIQVPATVQAVLAARIDRLSQEAKNLLQMASVIGTEVPFSLLQAIAEIPDDGLYDGLAILQAAEFLYETSLFPEHVYTFKHALTHEVAYSTLLQERRRVLHGRIVEALETLVDERLDDQAERIAHHALRGEMWQKALTYFRQAGMKAMGQSAYREASIYFEQALEAFPNLPQQRDIIEQGIDLWLALRTALRPLGPDRMLACLREAESLATAINDTRRLGQILLYLAVQYRITGQYDQAIAAGQRALEIARTNGDPTLKAVANLYIGFVYRIVGDTHRAIVCLRQSMIPFDGERHHEHVGQFIAPAVNARGWLAWCYAEQGKFDEGRALGEEGLVIAEEINRPASLFLALWGLGLLHLRQGDVSKAISYLERSSDVWRSFSPVQIWIDSARVEAYALAGRETDAASLLAQISQHLPTEETVDFQTFVYASLSEVHVQAGHLEEARTWALQALAAAFERHERGSEAYALNLLGRLAMLHNPPAVTDASDYYQQALTLANELSMRPLQAHCHRGLGTLYRQTGQSDQARAELTTAIEMYRDMDMTFWLPETESALAVVEGA